jgi:CarD family transcriptional regulator
MTYSFTAKRVIIITLWESGVVIKISGGRVIGKEATIVFKVGDRVVYPLYGAGTVEAVEDKLIDGVVSGYYVIDLPVGNLRITVSVAKADALGLRFIHTRDEVIYIINNAQPIEMSNNWTQRNKDNMEILRSGDLLRVVGVFKTLILRERVRCLSSVEKKLLGTTKQIILTEIILSQGVDKPSAEAMLNGTMPRSA